MSIEVENLSFSYRGTEKKVLKNINFRINEGEFVVVMGHTGAGKSTLCYCLNSLIPRFLRGEYHGNVVVNGFFAKENRICEMGRHVGLVFQDFESQLFSTNVELEVAFGPENYSVPREEIGRRIDEALRFVRLEKYRSREPSTLSGGQKQRLAIASILSIKPKIIVMDEPTTDLDPIGKYEIFEVAKKLKESTTLVLVEHETEEALMADRIAVMKKGEIIAFDKSRKILSNSELLKDAGVQPMQVAEFFQRLYPNLKQYPLTVDEAFNLFKKKRLKIKKNALEDLKKKDEKRDRIAKNKTIIEVKNLSYTYEGGVEALRNVNLKVRKGEFLAIIGQNGSGKTTLVKHFNGLLRPTKGKVFVDGKDAKDRSVCELGKIVGYVFQNPDHQIFADTVEKEVSFGPKNFGLRDEEVKKNVKEALKAVHLEGYEKEYPFLLTKGERQRVAVASILATKPQVIILDEPTTGLDYNQQITMMEMIKSLNEKGHTIIIVTHSMWVVAEYARRALVLKDGEILMDGSTREVFAREEELRKTFLKPPQIVRFGNRLGVTTLNVDEMVEVVS